MSDNKRIPVPFEVKRRTIELLDVKRMATLPTGEQLEVKLTAAQAIEQACKESGIIMRPNWGRLAGSFVFSWRKSLEVATRRETINKLRQQEIVSSSAVASDSKIVERAVSKPKTKIVATDNDGAIDGDLAAKFAAKLEAAKKKGDGKGKTMPGGCRIDGTEDTGDWSEVTSD